MQNGRFGACLMAEPALVRDCLGAMRDAVSVPVTIKCRIGIDDQDEDRDFDRFVDTVMEAGVTTFIVHARKAWLKGLSPKENREVPPLNYERVHRLKRRHAALTVIINGGITNLDDAVAQLAHVDGVMLGRAAYQTPWLLSEVDNRFYGAAAEALSPLDVVERMKPYIADQLSRGCGSTTSPATCWACSMAAPGAVCGGASSRRGHPSGRRSRNTGPGGTGGGVPS